MKRLKRALKASSSRLRVLSRRRLIMAAILIFILACLYSAVGINLKINKYSLGLLKHNPAKASRMEEKITYQVKLGALTLGEARFTNTSNVEFEGRDLNLMLVETHCGKFSDTERIYSEKLTNLPVRVERDIVNFFSREQISEEYDQKKFTVTITKRKGNKTEKQVIKKDGPIQNSVLLPYYVRGLPKPETGKTIIANLPTRTLRLKLIGTEKITVPAGTFEAYYFSSDPKQIKIWLSTDKRRIPLKIEGSGVLGYTMLMKEYNS